MYERVWEGTEWGLDGAEWDLTLDFDQDTGLFQVGGAMDGEPGAFVNARYSIDPDRLLRGHFHEGTRNKTVSGTAALKENLAKLDQKAEVDKSLKKEGRGWHV